MKIKLITAAVAAVLSTWAPLGSAARQSLTLAPVYDFGGHPEDTVGQETGVDTKGAGTLSVRSNININTLNNVGGGITSLTNNVNTIDFVGNSTVTGFTGTYLSQFLLIKAGTNATTVNFNGDVFTTQFFHKSTGTVNFNGNLNNAVTKSNYVFQGDGFLNIGINKIFNSAIVTEAGDNTGTITLNGGSSIGGAIGGTAALKQINVVNGNASVVGAVSVRDFNLGTNTLNIGGALTTKPGSVISTTIASDAVYGQIIPVGASNINGGGITVATTVTGVLTQGNTFNIVKATVGTDGAPVLVINNSPRYTFIGKPTLGGDVDIQLTKIIPLAALVPGPIAPVLDPILNINAPVGTDISLIQNAINNAPGNVLANLVAQIAPANTNLAAPWIASQAMQLTSDTWVSRLDEIQNVCCDTACDPNSKKPMPVKKETCTTNQKQNNWWFKGIGKVGVQDDVNTMNGYQAESVGAMVGYDVAVSEVTRLGLGAGYVNSNVNSKHSDNRTKVDTYQLSAYFDYAPEAFFVQGGVTAGINKYDSSRYIDIPGFSREAKSDTDGQQYSALITAGKHFGLNETTITPTVGLQASHLHVDSYKEHGAGGLNLRVDSQDYNFLQSIVGLKVERVIQSGNATYAPELHAKWFHDFNSTTMEQDAMLELGGSKFNIQGIKHDRDLYNVGVGMTVLSCNCDSSSWSVKGLYDYKWNDSDYDSHQVSLIAGYKF